MRGFNCSIRETVQTSTRIIDKLEKAVDFMHAPRARSFQRLENQNQFPFILNLVFDVFMFSSDSTAV